MADADLKADAEKMLQMAPVRTGGREQPAGSVFGCQHPAYSNTGGSGDFASGSQGFEAYWGTHSLLRRSGGPDSHRQLLSSVTTSAV